MVNGFFLGGAAKGIESSRNQRLQRDQLELNSELGRGRLALREREQERAAQAGVMQQVRERLSASVSNITQTAEALRADGKNPEQVMATLAPAIESVTSLASQAGLDGNLIAQNLTAQLAAPRQQIDPKENIARIEEFIKAAEKTGADVTALADSPQFQALVEPLTRAAAQSGLDPQIVADQINARIQAAAIRSGQADVQGNVIEGDQGVSSEGLDALVETADGVNFLGINLGPIKEPDSPTERKILNKAQEKVLEQESLVQDIKVFRDLIEATNTLGPITESTQPLVRAFEEIGIPLRTDQPLLEAIQGRQNLLALKFRNPESGFGLTGNTSDADREFLRSIPGGLGNTKEGAMLASLLLLIKLRRQAEISNIRANVLARGEGSKAQAIVKRYKKAVDAIRPDEKEFLNRIIQNADGDVNDLQPGESREFEDGVTITLPAQ